jgi:hypothetical protein
MLLKLKYTGKTSGGASKYEIQPTVVTPATPAIPASGTGANKIEAVPAVPASDNLAEILANLTDGLVVNENIKSEDGTFRTILSRSHCYLVPNIGDTKELNVVTETYAGSDNTHFSNTVGYNADKQKSFRLKATATREIEPIQILSNALSTADVSTSDYISLSKALLEISKLKMENKLLEKRVAAE